VRRARGTIIRYDSLVTDPELTSSADALDLVQTDRLGPDSWQFFVKFSYLFRF